MPVYVGGSRSLLCPPPGLAALLGQGLPVHVGCCTGADALVIQSAIRSASFSQVRVFAAFAQSGAGAVSSSAVSAVQSFALAGGAVQWLAGGPLSLPPAARLIRRSLAAAAGCSLAVFLSPGAGSLAVASQLAPSIPVWSFGPSAPQPIPGIAGAWQSAQLFGFAAWSWQNAQALMF